MKHSISVLAGSFALSLAAGAAQAQSLPIGTILDVMGGAARTAPAPRMAPPPQGSQIRGRGPTAAEQRPPDVKRRGADGSIHYYDGKTGRHTHTCDRSGRCINYGGDDNG